MDNNHLPQTSFIATLPTEILICILRRVRNGSTSGKFLACLQCCRNWRDLSTPLLYADVVLSKATIDPFIASLGQNGCSIRSLTLRIEGVPDESLENAFVELHDCGNLGTRNLWQSLRDLVPILKQMTRLTTFSLIVVPQSLRRHMKGFWLPVKDLNELLEALPRCCQNLEVDCYGRDRSARESAVQLCGTMHLCRIIYQLLPQLRHLRLRSTKLCVESFGGRYSSSNEEAVSPADNPIAPSLQTAIINVTNICDQHPPMMSRPALQTLQMYEHLRGVKTRNILYAHVRRCHETNMFPAIRRLSFIDETHYPEVKFEEFNERDIVLNKSYLQPFLPVPESWLARLHSRGEIFGALNDIQTIAEGTPWLWTSPGSRFPRDFASSDDAMDAGFVWQYPSVQSWAQSNWFSMQWVHEVRAGMKLMPSCEREGLGDTWGEWLDKRMSLVS